MEILITAVCAVALSSILSIAFIMEPRKKPVTDKALGEYK